MPGPVSPGLLRFNLVVPSAEAAKALRPYVEKHCLPRQLGNLQAGKRLRLDVPSVAAAVELWPLIFAYGAPNQLWRLRDLIALSTTPPPVDIQDDTEIKWLELGKYENTLRWLGYNTVGDLTGTNESQLRAHNGVGGEAIGVIKARLAVYGRSLYKE